MSLDYQELAFHHTPLGDLTLRRRRLRSLDNLEVHEIILGTGYLMSSLFTTVEIALADLALAQLTCPNLDIVVGGLGLGYTAQAALQNGRVGSLLVIEALPQVIAWHLEGLVPLGPQLTRDPRCRFLNADFFECSRLGFEREIPSRRFHAVLLDIDHSPRNLIHENHRAFYSEAGLARLAAQLLPGGVFAMWSDDPPDPEFQALLQRVFPQLTTHVVPFPNPLLGEESRSTVYLATLQASAQPVEGA